MSPLNHQEWHEHPHDEPSRGGELPTRQRVDAYRDRFAPEGRVELPRIDDQIDRMLAQIEQALEGFDGQIDAIIQVSPRMEERPQRELGIVGGRDDLALALEGNGLVGRQAAEGFRRDRRLVRGPDYRREGMRGRNWDNDRYARDSFHMRSARDGLQRFNPDLARRFDRTFQGMQRSMDGVDMADLPTREEMMQRHFQSRYRGLIGPNIFE